MPAQAPSIRPLTGKVLHLTVIIASLGYFVDMFDMFLFNMLRVKSLSELGYEGASLTEAGLLVLNCQFAGFLLGAYLTGILADKAGRKKTLYLSIILYAFGSIASAFARDVPFYCCARFLTGLGLAGEMGAGVTLIAERLAPHRRGYGIMIFIVMGFLGVLGASLAAEFLYWRRAYLLGGGLGLTLLFTRMLLAESGMYENMSKRNIIKGGLLLVFRKKSLFKTYVSAIFIMAPSVFIPQILWTLSPELAEAMGVKGIIKPNVILGIGFGSVIFGDLLAIALSEYLQSRKKATLIFLTMGTAIFLKYLLWPPGTAAEFYMMNAALGLTFGVWVIGAAWAAEQFGTNIRGTAVTTIPNFARGLTIPMNILYAHLKILGPLTAAGIIGLLIFMLAWLGWQGLKETYGKNLDYIETM